MSVAIPCPVSCKNIFAPINASPDEESEINPEIIFGYGAAGTVNSGINNELIYLFDDGWQNTGIKTAHNILLQQLLDKGLIGVFIFIYLNRKNFFLLPSFLPLTFYRFKIISFHFKKHHHLCQGKRNPYLNYFLYLVFYSSLLFLEFLF